MKYMGSKVNMLGNGLAQLLMEKLMPEDRFVDLFSGSGCVSIFVATNTASRVTAVDLQQYSRVLAASVLSRTEPLDFPLVWSKWVTLAFEHYRERESEFSADFNVALGGEDDPIAYVKCAREICGGSESPFVAAYGGYYFSPKQCLILDSLRRTIPHESDAFHDACLAALIGAASRAAASPGHTAQPFSPNSGAAKHLLEAWSKDIWSLTRAVLRGLATKYAQNQGSAHVGNANEWAKVLAEGDVAFIDPPYSGVHYSRFYHVLESLTSQEEFSAEGSGRYPPFSKRPRSEYSIGTQSVNAFDDLATELSCRGVRAIITYPTGKTSNGLSGSHMEEIADKHFRFEKHVFEGQFSTLGGNGSHRSARQSSNEMVLVCHPR